MKRFFKRPYKRNESYQVSQLYGSHTFQPQHILHMRFVKALLRPAPHSRVPALGMDREILLWQWKLGISMYCIYELIRDITYEEPNGNMKVLPPEIQPKFSTAKKCLVLACQSPGSVS